jgi:CBS domain-containing protein
MIPEHTKTIPLSSYSLDELLPDSLLSSPAVGIRTTDTVADAASLLAHHLESFTDSLVVTKDAYPVGLVGGIELLDGVLKNPTYDFFDNTLVGEIMNDKLAIITKQTKLSDLLKQWQQTRRAFAIIPNQYHGYSVVSARKLLEVGALSKTDMRVLDMPKKRLITFTKDYTVKEIIVSMFENKTRKLILEDVSLFISDRIITEKIAHDLNYLRNVNNFLDMKADIFKLESPKIISEDTGIPAACKIMSDMLHPYLMAKDQVISPWDIVMILGSENLVRY